MDRKLLHLHMPKTAGSAINHHFTAVLGDERCQSFVHPTRAAEFQSRDFIAGHLYLKTALHYFPGRFVFAFLRHPVSHLASQIRWLDHYNESGYLYEKALFPMDIQQTIEAVAQTDFADPESLDRFFSDYPTNAMARTINAQSEYLAFTEEDHAPRRPEEHADLAIAGLDNVDFVGLTEAFDDHLSLLCDRLGITHPISREVINKSPALRQIDLKVREIYAVLSKHCQADLILYEHVKKNFL